MANELNYKPDIAIVIGTVTGSDRIPLNSDCDWLNPSSDYNILTEASDDLITEDNDYLIQEAG